MRRIKLDSAAPAVKKLLRHLPAQPHGVELELGGEVIGTLLPPPGLSEAEKAALRARGRALVQRARRLNKGVSARVLEREVDQAVREARTRRRA
jgi:hypothetical protein